MTDITDAFFEALSNRQRRRVLRMLLEQNPRRKLVVPEAVYRGDAERQELESEMYHVHLPKLEELGFIAWDRDDRVVTPGPRFDDVTPYLQIIYEHRHKLADDWE